MADFLSGAVKQIVVETEWLPPIVIDNPFAPAPPGVGSVATRILKPKITLVTSLGTDPIVFAPYGQPTPNWELVKNLATGLGFLYVGLRVVRAVRKRSHQVPGPVYGRPVSGLAIRSGRSQRGV